MNACTLSVADKSKQWIASLLVIALAVIFFRPFVSEARGGGMDAGGGNSFIAHLLDSAREELRRAKSSTGQEAYLIDRVYRVTVDPELRVEGTRTPLVLNGKSVDAINYPSEKLITVFLPRLEELTGNDRTRIMIHELAGIAGVADKNYEFSFSVLESTKRSGNVASSSAAGRSCYERTEKKGIGYVVGESTKAILIPLLREFVLKSSPHSSFRFGEPTVKQARYSYDRGLPYVAEYASIEIPVIVLTGEGSEVSFTLKDRGNGSRLAWISPSKDALGRVQGCNIRFGNAWGWTEFVLINNESGLAAKYFDTDEVLRRDEPLSIDQFLQ